MFRTSLKVIGAKDEQIAWLLYEGKSLEAIAESRCWTLHRLQRRLQTNWKIKFFLNELMWREWYSNRLPFRDLFKARIGVNKLCLK